MDEPGSFGVASEHQDCRIHCHRSALIDQINNIGPDGVNRSEDLISMITADGEVFLYGPIVGG